MAETEVSISDIFKAYKQSYANKESVVPWITPLTKTPTSRNITIEDWNSAMTNTQSVASDSVASYTIFCSLESSLENGKFADGLKVVISKDDTRSLTEICKSLSGYMKPSDIKFIQDGNTYTITIGTSNLLTFTIPTVPSFGEGLSVSNNTVSVDFTTVAKKSDIPNVPSAGEGLTTDESGNYAVDYSTVSGTLGISNKLEQSDISVVQDSGNSLKYNVIVKGTTVGTITIPADKYVSTVTYDSENKQIVFTFSKGENVKVNVADLIDTYTAGTGLKLEGNQFSIDEEYLSSKTTTAEYVNVSISSATSITILSESDA